MSIYSFNGRAPKIHPSAFIADGVQIIGDVTIGEEVGVWFNSVIRGDDVPITIGRGSNIQDQAVVHTDSVHPTCIGEYVTVGHGATVHAATIEDLVLVGINAVVLNRAVVGTGSIIAAGAVVLEGKIIPPRSLVAGVPGKVIAEVNEEQLMRIKESAENYIHLLRSYKVMAQMIRRNGD